MLNKNRISAILGFLLVALLLLHCSSQKEWSGEWKIETRFGNATLTVNDSGTLITKVEYEFTCGSARRASGTLGKADGSEDAGEGHEGWPIDQAGRFELKNVVFLIDFFGGPEAKAFTTGTMSGEFKSGGRAGSGQWELRVNDGTVCSGPWRATR